MLEPEEKTAGRLFRDLAQADLDRSFVERPPTYDVPDLIAIYRHECPARDGRSSAMDLAEKYVPSPSIVVETDDDGRRTAYLFDHWVSTEQADLWQVPAGRLAFIYREGRCRCGQTARSRTGRLVDAWQRPPLWSRLIR